MRNKFLILFIFTLILLSACSRPVQPTAVVSEPTATSAPATETPDLQATVNAGVQSTMVAQANMQATIDAAVTATISAMPQEEAQPQISEEEMSAEIDTAVNEAVAATEEVATTTEEIAADGQVTPEEYDELEALLVETAVLIDYAEYWIDTYYWYYGDLAEETLALLEEVEQILVYTEEYMDEIIVLLEAGNEIADATLTALEDLAANAENTAAQLTEKAENWQAELQAWEQTRAENALNFQPNQIPGSRQEALQAALDYVDTVRASLEDKVISATELQNIAQLGANAVAGLQAHGGNALQGLAGSINQITQQAALGQFGQVSGALGSLEASIPKPSRP